MPNATQIGIMPTAVSTSLTFTASANASGEGYNWEGGSSLTLTLSGIDLATDEEKTLTVPTGTTIVLKDGTTNNIKSTATSGNSYGIYCNGGLTITGETAGTGILNVTSGATSGESIGIYYCRFDN